MIEEGGGQFEYSEFSITLSNIFVVFGVRFPSRAEQRYSFPHRVPVVWFTGPERLVMGATCVKRITLVFRNI